MKTQISCPHCGQLISETVSAAGCVRAEISLLVGLKEELIADIAARTSWGKNQLEELLNTVFNKTLENL